MNSYIIREYLSRITWILLFLPNKDVPTTGVIEGAIRYLIKDRMDITGARWSLEGAEAVLRLRSLHVSGDWNEHWRFHLLQERQRHHLALHQGGIPLLKDVTQARCSTTNSVGCLTTSS